MLAERVGGERLSQYFTALGLTKPAKVELIRRQHDREQHQNHDRADVDQQLGDRQEVR